MAEEIGICDVYTCLNDDTSGKSCKQQRSLRGGNSTLHHKEEEIDADDYFDWSSEACHHEVSYSYANSPVDCSMDMDSDWEWNSTSDGVQANFDYGDGVGNAEEDDYFSFDIVDSEIVTATATSKVIVEPDDYYSEEYYAWNCSLQEKYSMCDSLINQPQVQSVNRATLIAWLSKVIRSLDLFPETLFLTANIVDRFLASTPISLECLQLLGLTALFIAAKQLEIYHPSLNELSKLGAGVYSKQNFIQMEQIILKQLQFHFVVATSLFFVEYYITYEPLPEKKRNRNVNVLMERPYCVMVRNLVELCIQDYNLCRYTPSCVALSSMAVVEEYAVGRPIDLSDSRYARWDYPPSLLKQCTTDIWLHLSRSLHGPIRILTDDTFFEKYQLSTYEVT